MKGKLTAFLLSGTLVVSGISQIVLADDQIKDPVIEKNDEEILQEETKVNPKLEEDPQKQVDEETLEKEVNEAAPFIRGKLSERLEIRHTPELIFIYDESIEYGNKIEKIIEKINEDE